jgi:hypothetical protein
MKHEAKEEKHKKTRKFNGHIYHLHGEEKMTKTGAESYAQHLRNRGNLVRIVKEPGEREWIVYVRRK